MKTAQQLVDEVATLLRDPKKLQWTEPRLIEALNSAFQSLCTLKTDAFTVCEDITLKAGTEQSIPSDAHSVVEALSNICPNTGTEKRAVTKADKSAIDAADPHWRQAAKKGFVKQWMNSLGYESKFFVYPPVNAGVVIRMILSKTPYVVEDTVSKTNSLFHLSDELPVDRVYYPFLHEWMLYYSYHVDDEMSANQGRAQGHFEKAFNLLGLRAQAQMALKEIQETQE